MGDVLKPNLKAWKNKQEEVDAASDRVLFYCQELTKLFTQNIDPVVVQLASLRLLQKHMTQFLAESIGPEGAKQALAMAAELAAQYEVVEPQ